MNRIFSVVWNRALRVLQVASELTRGSRGGSTAAGCTLATRRNPLALACLVAFAIGAYAPLAWSGYNVTISNGADFNITSGSGAFKALGTGATVNAGEIGTALTGSAIVSVFTNTAANGIDLGNITVSNAVTASGTGQLYLQAVGSIFLNASLSSGGTGPLDVSLWANYGATDARTSYLSGTNCGTCQVIIGDGASASITTGGGDVYIQTGDGVHAGGSLQLGTSSTFTGSIDTGGGALNVIAIGINQWATGASTITAGAANLAAGTGSITLTNPGNDFSGAVSLSNTGANDVALSNATSLLLGNVSVGSGTLTLSGAGISQAAGTAVIQAAGAGAATFNAGAGALTLANAGNDFTGAVSLNNSGANNVTLSNGSNALILGASNVGSGTLTVNATGITEAGAITQAAGAGAASFNAGAGALTLNQANDFTGAVSLNNSGANNVTLSNGSNALMLGASNVGSGTLAVSATGITEVGAITQAAGSGAANFNAGAGVLTLNQANEFTGAVSLNNSGANNVTLNNGTNALQLDSSNVGSGTLTVSATGITEAGAITQAAGAGMATFNAGAGVLTLNQANAFTGAVSLNNSGANNVSLNNGSNTLQLGTSNVGSGTLAVSATGITEVGAITQGAGAGAANFDAGAGVLTLNQVNAFTGTVSLNNSGANNVVLNNGTNALQLGTSNVGSGALTVSGVGISQVGAITQAAGAGAVNFNAGAGVLTLNQANDFTGTVSLNNSGANNVTLNNGTNALQLGTSNVGSGALTVSGVGISQTGAITQASGAGGATFNAGAGAITLASANAFTGAVRLNNSGANNVVLNNGSTLLQLGVSGVGSGSLNVSGAGISQTGVITQAANAGATLFNAGADALTLDYSGNDFTGLVTAIGTGVAINDANDLAIGGITDNGNGDVSLIAGGTLALPGSGIDAGSGNLVLASNGGSLATAGNLSAANVSLSGASGLLLGNVTASGTLDLASQGGNIAQTAGVVSAGTLKGSSLGAMTLTAAGNQVNNLGDFSADGFSLSDGGPLTVSGTVDGGPGGTAITTNGNLSISGTVGHGTGNISLGTNGSLDITGSVNGGNVNLSATGNTLLTGTLGSTGGTTLSAGNLQIGNGSQAGTLTGDLNLAGSTNGVIFDEPVATTYGGVISGAGTLTQQGPGTLILNGASTATGLTTVATGSTLLVGDSSHATATVGGDVSVNGGTLGGFGTIKGSATLANSATLAPGAVQGDGTLTIDGDLTIGDGSQLDFDFGAPGPNFGTPGQSDHVTVNGNLSIGTSTLNVNNVGGMGPGLYNLFNWGGSLAITGGGFAPPNGMSLQILTVDKQINLVDTQGLTLNEWDANGLAGPGAMGGGSGTWSTSSNTWSDTTGQYVGPMAPQPGFAIFGGAPGTVAVDDTNGQVSVTGMQFAVDGYTLLGGPLTLVASNGVAPVIRVGDGSSNGAGMTATIDSKLTGSDGFTKTDAGTLILGGQGTSNTLTGGIAVQGGTLLLGNDAGGGGLSSFDDAVMMSSGTSLIVDSATLQPGKYGSVTTGRAAVSGSGFSVGVGYTGAGNIYGGVGGKYQSGFAGGAGIGGSDFVVTNASGGQIDGGAGGISTSRNKTDTGGNGGIGIDGSGFTLTNAGYVSGGVGGPGSIGGAGGAAMYGSAFTATNQGGGKIVGGPGGSGKYTAGMGGAAVGGSGFTLVNQSGASIRGGQGGEGMNAGAIGGAGGAAVAGTGFTLVNSGNIYGGQGGYYNTQGNGTAGLGGIGVVGLGGANVTTSGLIAGGLDGSLYSSKTPGTQRADAVEFSGGGNTLTLESGFSFQGNVVSTSGTTNGGDTLALGGTASGAFDVSNIVDGLPANATATQYAGFNAFEKTGTGTWTLTGSGTNAASENWTIANGTLQGDATTFAHSATLTFAPGAGDTAALVFDQGSSNANSPATAAFGGAISGNGGVTKIDDGTLILTGANTFTGGTTVSAGTLQIGNGGTAGSIVGDVADAGALVFDRADAVTFAGAISGNGSLVQEGAGTLILNGDSGAFTGATRISDGALVVGDDAHANAALGGTVTVAKGATLAGIGTIGGMDLSGTLSPGGSIGTLHVSGNATFEQGSMFNVEASPDGTSDQLAVGGTVTIKGGSVVAIAQAGNWAPQTTYTIISAGQGVSGTFGGVSDNLAFLTPVLAYSANAVSLSLQRNDINFADVALTPNQKGAATGEQGLGFGNALYDALVKLDAPTARNAFDQTSGEYHASQQTARINDSRYVREAMDQRLRAGDADPEAAKQGDTNLSAWAHAWGHWGTTDSDGNAGRLADNGDGLLVGADLPVGTQARIGVTGGASRNSLSVGSRASWGRLTSQWLGAFGGFEQGAFALRGGIAYGWDQVPSNREIAFPGYSDRLSGNAAGDTLTGFVESAWTFKLAQGSIAPFVNLAHTRVETDASNEAGGAAALHASEGSANVSFSTVGARGSVQFARGLDVHGELGWQHAFGDTTPERTLQFVAGGPAFTEYGVPIAKNAGLGKAGIGWHAGRVAIDADYEGLFGGGAKDQAAKLSVSVAF